MAKRPLTESSPPDSGPGSPQPANPKKPRQRKNKAKTAMSPVSRMSPLAQSPPYASSPQTPQVDEPRPRPAPAGQDAEDDLDAEAVDEEEEEELMRMYGNNDTGVSAAQRQRENEELMLLLSHFTPEQMERYEAYRRSALPKGGIRKLVNQILQQTVSPNIVTVIRGFSKVFVGEIIEKAKQISHHDGPLTPDDLREAYRIYLLERDTPSGTVTPRRKLFTK